MVVANVRDDRRSTDKVQRVAASAHVDEARTMTHARNAENNNPDASTAERGRENENRRKDEQSEATPRMTGSEFFFASYFSKVYSHTNG
jgi:IS5 family transposase